MLTMTVSSRSPAPAMLAFLRRRHRHMSAAARSVRGTPTAMPTIAGMGMRVVGLALEGVEGPREGVGEGEEEGRDTRSTGSSSL